MLGHEYFRELCALAAIGQLSSDEERELSQHLYECENCRRANAAYAHVIQHQLPKADSIRRRFRDLLPKSAPSVELRDKFLARARAEGVEFSPEVALAGRPMERSWLRVRQRRRLSFAAVTLLLVVLGGIAQLKDDRLPKGSGRGEEARFARENESLRTQVGETQAQLSAISEQLAAAQKGRVVSEETLRQLRKDLDESRAKSETLAIQYRELETKEVGLANDSLQKDVLVADLNAKNEKLHHENVDNLTFRILLEGQLRQLRESIAQQEAGFEQERELFAASKDVRQLMGARNLHIMDVHDTDGAGKAAKSFGRVFYAEGQSLVFYAFDLQSAHLTPAKYTFQAWGEKESVSHSLRNLGTFTVDDHEQRRWVLKVNDPKLLHGIDSVFVTAESVGDAREPRGKKLLYAYLVGQANHP